MPRLHQTTQLRDQSIFSRNGSGCFPCALCSLASLLFLSLQVELDEASLAQASWRHQSTFQLHARKDPAVKSSPNHHSIDCQTCDAIKGLLHAWPGKSCLQWNLICDFDFNNIMTSGILWAVLRTAGQITHSFRSLSYCLARRQQACIDLCISCIGVHQSPVWGRG